MIVYLICQFEPSSEVTTSITGYISAYLLRGGAHGDRTLIRVYLPATLSYQATRSPRKRWCLDLSARLTALQVRASIFYQWRRWSGEGFAGVSGGPWLGSEDRLASHGTGGYYINVLACDQ